MRSLGLLFLFVSLGSCGQLYQAFFEPKTAEDEACKYIVAAFGGAWVIMLCTIFTCWLIRRRPIPVFTYELLPSAELSSAMAKIAVTTPLTNNATPAEQQEGSGAVTEPAKGIPSDGQKESVTRASPKTDGRKEQKSQKSAITDSATKQEASPKTKL